VAGDPSSGIASMMGAAGKSVHVAQGRMSVALQSVTLAALDPEEKPPLSSPAALPLLPKVMLSAENPPDGLLPHAVTIAMPASPAKIERTARRVKFMASG
jgi:hypothetical protein